MFNIFKKRSVTLIDEKWNLIRRNVKLDFLPRIHELIYIGDEDKYYRVVNVIYHLKKSVEETFVIIEKYTDDYKLIDKEKEEK